MTNKQPAIFLFCTVLFCISLWNSAAAQRLQIIHDTKAKTISFGTEKMAVTLDYNKKANISALFVNGQPVITGDAGIYSAVHTKGASYSTLHLLFDPVVNVAAGKITVTGITFGGNGFRINETWVFTVNNGEIQWYIDRDVSKSTTVEKVSFPVFQFNNINTWEGAYTDYGGLAWFYLFNKKLDTYGVHSSNSRFWNSKTGNGLTIDISSPGRQVAMDYSRTAEDKMACTVAVSPSVMRPRFDNDTHRRRYVRDTTDVWAPFTLPAGKSSQTVTLSYFDFEERFGRGKLVGINGQQVSAVLNTIARIGVIDKQHFGGNSWHTPYGPICLHEQYIAQMGLGINDPAYLKGYQQCLDFYRDNAIQPDGRVWPRWAYSNEDAMPKIYTDKGFYEAQWGYLLDSNPDFVTNVAELYDQTGDVKWVKTQQAACEKALDWIMKRDSNHNGLVEMITDSHQQKRGSDWIDIIWAAYENAFVNAKLYHALVLWSDIEQKLGNKSKAEYYQQFAAQLKASFNKSVTAGGLWDDSKKCYVHWRDKDGSIHGNNMVTPVNFMAIAYGICDDVSRRNTILDNIEVQMRKENLFFWPICMSTYAPGEGNDWQFPFPNYENGDLFLSWGAVGVQAYAAYKPELALQYVKNVLAQYAKDGLAFQRYGRAKQDGLGDDILSGNSLSVVGLYQGIYGINPRANRFYLDPHITKDLAGTQIRYNYQNQELTIDLDMQQYAVSNKRHTIRSTTDFGFYSTSKSLSYFHGNTDKASLTVTTPPKSTLTLDIRQWTSNAVSFTQSSKDTRSGQLVYQINGLSPNAPFAVRANNKPLVRIKSDSKGTIVFTYATSRQEESIEVNEE